MADSMPEPPIFASEENRALITMFLMAVSTGELLDHSEIIL